MSKKQPQQKNPTLSPLANAMYNAEKKEITSSIITSLSFLGVGGLVTLFSIVKYFKISANITDNSEKLDAFAWLVIAGVGVGVIAIGVVNMLKSFTSLGQLGSILKRTESHASPFQDQQLSKRVAQMNQSQAMKKAEIASAEQLKQEKRTGLGLFGINKLSSSELYDRYNPQKQTASTPRMTAPPKSKPLMEQKFDYGIHEEKELSFADEFLMKNKRDPFAQYRKELGIKEEAPKPVEHKPQFISTSSMAKQASVVQGVGRAYSENMSSVPSKQSANSTGYASAPRNSGSMLSELDFSGNFGENNTSAPAGKTTVQEQPKPKSILSELDFDGSFGSDTVTSPIQNIPKEQPKPRSLLSELDFGGTFGEDTDTSTPAAKEAPAQQPKPRSLLSELDFGGTFGEDTDTSTPAAKEAPAQQPKPRSLLSELDFGGTFGEDTDTSTPAAKEAPAQQPKPRSLLSELDFGGTFGEDTDTTSTPAAKETPAQQPKPRSILSELDFGGDFGEATAPTPVAPTEPSIPKVQQATPIPQPQPQSAPSSQPEVQKAPIDDPVARRASVRMISFLSDKSSDSFAELTGVEKIPDSQSSATSPYGIHREEDNGMFFTAQNKNNTSSTQQAYTQQQQRQNQQTAAYNLDSFAETKPRNRPNSSEFSSEIVKNGTPAQRKYVEASEFDEWTCPECGKTNQEYVGVCACGRRKPRRKF